MNKLMRLAALAALVVVCAVPVAAEVFTSPGNYAYGPYTLQSAAYTGNGNVWDTQTSSRTMTLYVQWDAGTTAGGITIETSPASATGYSGTWAPLATVAWSAASKQDVVQITAPVGSLRARVSTNVTNSGTQVIPAANVTLATNVIEAGGAHGWKVGQPLYYLNGGGAGMTYATGVDLSNTVVYVRTVPAATTFTISLTLGGAVLDLDGQGTNAQSFVPGGVSVTAFGLGK
jgi:hypothetical protein